MAGLTPEEVKRILKTPPDETIEFLKFVMGDLGTVPTTETRSFRAKAIKGSEALLRIMSIPEERRDLIERALIFISDNPDVLSKVLVEAAEDYAELVRLVTQLRVDFEAWNVEDGGDWVDEKDLIASVTQLVEAHKHRMHNNSWATGPSVEWSDDA